MSIRVIAVGSLMGLVALVLGCTSGAKLVGTNLDKTQAPDFTLRDATGSPFSLHEFQGKTVWLMFLYTHCPDICPAIAGKAAAVARQLGPDAGKVEFLAVSVDPVGDTPASVQEFTSEHGLDALGSRWRYGLGSAEQLAAVWHQYGIGAIPRPAALSNMPGGDAPAVDHNTEMYLIDQHGRERLLVHADDTIDALTSDIKALAHGE